MEEPPHSPKRTRVESAGVTDVGRQRKHNEDCLLLKPEHGLYCVADGMGGHNAGDVASKLVATSLGNYFEAVAQGAPELELPDDYAALSPGARRLAAGVSKANRDVFIISNTHQQHHGMGSTCVAVHLAEGMMHIAHVGDSRCYRVRDGEIEQMTRDHSLINDALDMKPDLTKDELARLPKNIITRALGMKDLVKVDIKSVPALPGDVFLLCSDGLTGMVPVSQILDLISITQDAKEACELLVAEANDHGGTDNISALLVRIDLAQADSEGAIDISAHAELETDDADAEAVSESELETETETETETDAEPVSESELETETEPDGEPPAISDPVPPPAATVEPLAAPVEALAEPPHVEVEPSPGGLDGALSPEETAALEAGAEIDLDVRGPWPNKPTVRRCATCRFELFPGNRFCVECGALIEAAIA